MTGTPKARHASAIPSTASASCHMTSACSGLPKFRQLTRATGRAPTTARLRYASATSIAVPWPGSTAHQRWLPSVVSARARPVSTPVVGCFKRRTVASPPGATTVLRNSWWSYWCHTQLRVDEHPEESGGRDRHRGREPGTDADGGPLGPVGRLGAGRS